MKPGVQIAVAGLCAALAGPTACGSGEDLTGPQDLPPPSGFFGLSRDFVDTLSFGGHDRVYRVHFPRSYDHRTRLPLLLVFHGSGASFDQMREWTGFDSFADDESFVVVYPGAYRSWSEADVGFVPELVDHLTELWAVDPARVALTGFSAGGFLSHRLACEFGFPVRAVATVGATVAKRDVCEHPGFGLARRVSAFVMLGDEDPFVPPEGSDDALSQAESVAMWRTVDGCTGPPAVVFQPSAGATPHVRTEVWTHCSGDAEVQSAVMVGLGHLWPRPAADPNSIDATRIVTAFVVRQW